MKSSSIFTALLTENYSYMQMTLLLSQLVLFAFWQDSVFSEDERIDLMVDVPSLNYWKLWLHCGVTWMMLACCHILTMNIL